MAPAAATEEEKAKKAAEKARRKAEFEAKRAKEGNPPKKKQLSKAERRELQEKQRADKEAKKNPKPKADKPPPPPVERPRTILGHLPKATSSTPPADGVPASIVELGQKYAQGEFDGSNDRCRSLLDAVRSSIKDYAPPADAAAARDLDVKLKSWASYLEKCREPTASTLAALKRLRLVASTLPPDISPSEACPATSRDFVEDTINSFGPALETGESLRTLTTWHHLSSFKIPCKAKAPFFSPFSSCFFFSLSRRNTTTTTSAVPPSPRLSLANPTSRHACPI